MRKIKQLSLAAVVAAMLCSCSGLFHTVTYRTEDIQPGMTKQEVQDILGKATFRSFDEVSEQWEYRSQLIDGDYDVLKVEFRDGRVISMNSFREIRPRFPEKPKNP